jgi:cytochrome P450
VVSLSIITFQNFLSAHPRYEFYYDVILGGRYWYKIGELHEKYGPVVRINPYELHFSDPEFYDTIYASAASGLKRDRWEWSHRYLGIPGTSLLTVDHEHHRLRKAAFGPFFSTASIRKLQPIIDRIVNRMMERFQDYQSTGEVMVVNRALAAFANGQSSS